MAPDDGIARKTPPLTIREQAEHVLRLAPAERLKFLIEAPKPLPLVRALPDGDFYLTVREVGPDDAGPLLQLASAPQLTHLLDLEGWRGDRFDPLRCGAWVALLAETGEPTLKRFVRNADDETLVLLFRDWAHVRPLEIDHEEPTRGHGVSDAGDERGFISPDGGHLFAPERPEHVLAVRRLAETLYLDDQPRYAGLIRTALFDLPSEVEESALRWRLSRLEEHGYPPLEEATQIYEPPAGAHTPPPAPAPPSDDGLAASHAALRVLGPRGLIATGVDALPPEARERVLFGLSSLANRVLVADAADAGSIDAHRRVLERAASYVSLALEARGAHDGAHAAPILAEVFAVDLFREGYQQAAALRLRARQVLATGWGGGHAHALDLLDGPLRARVSALLQPRPLYVETAEDGASHPRDFRRVAEIEETRLTLDLADSLAKILLAGTGTSAASILDEERHPFEERARFSTLLLTMLAWHAARGALRIERLPQDVIADFLRTTASRRTASPEAATRAMEKLLDAVAPQAAPDRRVAASLRLFAATCLDRLAADCGGLVPGTPVTPRVVGCVRIA